MEHERFDQLARAVSSGNTRRKVLGGALAGIFGAGLAAVASVDAKKKGKGRKKGSKGRKKAGAEFICSQDPNVCGPFACCQDTPAGNNESCLGFDLQAGTDQCGDPGSGDGVCRTCPPGTRCSGFPLFLCVCDSVSCPNGCCIDPGILGDDGACIENGSGEPVDFLGEAFFVCGVGGAQCNQCSAANTLFSGCCSATGVCQSGTTGSNCGNSGLACDVCPQGEECGIDQTCSGDPPPPPPPNCTAGLTECPAGSGTCVNLGTNPSNCGSCGNSCPACGKRRRRRCDGGTCGCGKKRRRRKKK